MLLVVACGAALHSNHQRRAPLSPAQGRAPVPQAAQDRDPVPQGSDKDRRLFIRALASTAASLPALASAERTGLLDVDATGLSLPRAFELSLPKPDLLRANRQPLDQQFAVCMMRSSYNTVDELDFCAMDAFQKEFFVTRQDEWQPYLARARKTLGTAPEQGELTDPLYFDFISYAQYETINSFLRKPKKLFEELVSAEGETRVVARNASSVDDRLLATEHARRVGDKVLDFVLERFGTGLTQVKVAPELSIFAVEANAQKLVTLLAVLGFSIDSVAERRGNKLLITFVGAANYWGLRSVSQGLGRPALVNDFGAKVVGAWLARCGYPGARAPAATTFDAAAVSYTHEFRLS